MMASQLLSCPYYTCKDFKTQQGLTQHQQNSVKCRDLLQQKYGIWYTASYPHDNICIQRLIPTQGKSDLHVASKTIVRLQCISQTKDLENGTEQEEFILDVYEDGHADEDYGGFPMIDNNSKNSESLEELLWNSWTK